MKTCLPHAPPAFACLPALLPLLLPVLHATTACLPFLCLPNMPPYLVTDRTAPFSYPCPQSLKLSQRQVSQTLWRPYAIPCLEHPTLAHACWLAAGWKAPPFMRLSDFLLSSHMPPCLLCHLCLCGGRVVGVGCTCNNLLSCP